MRPVAVGAMGLILVLVATLGVVGQPAARAEETPPRLVIFELLSQPG